MSADIRGQVVQTLTSIAASDPDGFVKGQAQKALDALKALAPPPAGKQIYVEVGPMSDASKVGGAPIIATMRSTVEGTLTKKNASFVTKWPSGKSPTKAELSKTAGAFFVDGTLTAMSVKKTGSLAEVSCNVSLFIATYPEKSMFAFLKGGAQVQAGADDKEIAGAKSDCVSAVLEDLVGRQVAPAIQQRVPQ